ncbi:MAG: Hpt domain-containing protein [Defluviitaleaceae bacterium]|nr:Hpt domain-containing protein [Defluviitaleaceae bacterium]
MKKLNREEINLRKDFLKGQKYTFEDLQAEISSGHFSTAYRLVHTLKGTAGLIKEEKLADIAFKIEQQLRNGENPVAAEMAVMESELNRVLTEITDSGILDDDKLNIPPTLEEQKDLFDRLQTLLKENDAQCIKLAEEIALIPETKVLVRQVETYSYKDALVTLKVLREVLQV